jgi:hypothetical protein
VRNTTKWNIEKLTPKPAKTAAPLAAISGTNLAAMTRAVLLAMAPSTPDATKVPYDFQGNCRPDSAAGDSRVHDIGARHRHQPGHDPGSDEHDAKTYAALCSIVETGRRNSRSALTAIRDA